MNTDALIDLLAVIWIACAVATALTGLINCLLVAFLATLVIAAIFIIPML
jgi:hypothetical protein